MIYQQLPPDYVQARPIIQKILKVNASSITPLVSTRRRPDPPRSLIAQAGSLEALITWNAPQKFDDIAGWRVYRDNEGNLVDAIFDVGSRQYRPKLPANTPTAFYVSSINNAGRESIKVQVIAKANTDQYVTTGTGGGTSGSSSSTPPGYNQEPSGGGRTSRIARF